MMTLEQLDALIESRLGSETRPVIEFNRLARVVGVPDGSWYFTTRDLDKPASFHAGGTLCLTVEEAVRWCKWLVRTNPKRFGVSQ